MSQAQVFGGQRLASGKDDKSIDNIVCRTLHQVYTPAKGKNQALVCTKVLKMMLLGLLSAYNPKVLNTGLN